MSSRSVSTLLAIATVVLLEMQNESLNNSVFCVPWHRSSFFYYYKEHEKKNYNFIVYVLVEVHNIMEEKTPL